MKFPYKHAHFVGIKGAGMASLAMILKAHGISVTGSDSEEIFFTDILLRKAGIKVFSPFSQKNISRFVDVIVYSTAYNQETNEEISFAEEQKIPSYSYPEFLGMITKQKMSVAVSGTHGKTTTTAMLGHVLNFLDKEPSALVGSEVLNWKSGALSGTGPYFIFESDEYQNKFRYYYPWSLIITNVTWDHPDFFPTKEEYENTFKKYVEKIPLHGWIVVSNDDLGALKVTENVASRRLTYGYHKDSKYRIFELSSQKGFAQSFSIQKEGKELGIFSLQLLGKHNIQNATAVIAFCDALGIPLEMVGTALKNFLGTTRRMEKKGEYKKALLYDDYAHHPEEIEASLLALRKTYPKRKIITVFQPHTFSRTETFMDSFALALDYADVVLLLDIYASAREKVGTISSDDLVAKINHITPEKALNVHSLEKAEQILLHSLDKNIVLVTMGAGDVWRVGESILKNK